MITEHYSSSAEQSVLGSILQKPDAYDEIAGTLSAEMFYSARHISIFRIIARMLLEASPVDVITVAEECERQHILDEIGGLGYLAELHQNTPSATNIKRYAAIVHANWQERRLIAAGHDIIQLVDDKQPINTCLTRAMEMVSTIAETRTAAEPQPIGNALIPLLAQIESAYENGTGLVGASTGLHDLDDLLGGLRGGQLIIIGGRPAMGKSSIALQIAAHDAEQRNAVLVLSLEMPATELAAREVSRASRIPVADLMRGKLREDDWAKLTHGASIVNNMRMIVDDQSNLSLIEVAAKARTAKRKHKIGMLVIDYLQLMRGEGDNRNQELESITRGLKSLAKDLDIPVIALSQLSRKCEERTNKRPMLSDLRESGGIEQDADVVIFVYRDEVYNPDSQDIGTAELIVAKQRNGPPGRIRVTFLGEYTQFADYMGPQTFEQQNTTPKRRGM